MADVMGFRNRAVGQARVRHNVGVRQFTTHQLVTLLASDKDSILPRLCSDESSQSRLDERRLRGRRGNKIARVSFQFLFRSEYQWMFLVVWVIKRRMDLHWNVRTTTK